MTWTVAYRYVGYGTRFQSIAGERASAESLKYPPHHLYDNEVAVDVGSQCLRYEGCQALVIDHHFPRAVGNFPSASAAVLHNAEELCSVLRERFGPVSLLHTRQAAAGDHEDARPPGENRILWLVSHASPDFDAFCAMFLVRSLLDGTCPHKCWAEHGVSSEGWVETSEKKLINWFAPDVHSEPDEYRWPILLASYASHVDQCRPVRCPRNRSLHSVLHAAQIRGLDLKSTGASTLLSAARESMCDERRRNPLVEPVFDLDSQFRGELELLAGEEERYARDLLRARRAIVLLKEERFEEWYAREARDVPLLKGASVDERHLRAQTPSSAQTDAVFIRDPESLLFKEWAREDRANSPSGAGFLFTAVANSGAKPRAPVNQTEYFFSLDPERSGNRHLYNIWARLQHEEWVRRGRPPLDIDGRADFRNRRVGDDPWYDGNAYHATIVVTPNKGTSIPGGLASDLSDDEVTRIVRAEVEDVIFATSLEWEDLPLEPAASAGKNACPVAEVEAQDVVPGTFRLASIRLADLELTSGAMAEQIGRRIWPILLPRGVATTPLDFVERHLIVRHEHIVAWNRRGVVVAHRSEAAAPGGVLEGFRKTVRTFAEVMREIRGLASGDTDNPIETGRQILRKVAGLKLAAAGPEGQVFQRLYEATRFEEVLATLHALHDEERAEGERRRDILLQWIFAAGASIAIWVSVFQLYALALQPTGTWLPLFILLGFIPLLLASLNVLRRRTKTRRRPFKNS